MPLRLLVKCLLWISPLGALYCFEEDLIGAGIFWGIVAVCFYSTKFCKTI